MEWAPRIRTLAERTKKLFIFFNNHAKAQAVTNAGMLINLGFMDGAVSDQQSAEE